MGVFLSKVLYKAQEDLLVYYCPGCRERHLIPLKPSPVNQWSWNGDAAKPSFSPSLKHLIGLTKVCHVTIQGGKLTFHEDSHHRLRGETVDMWPVNLEDRYKMTIEDTSFHPPKMRDFSNDSSV